MYVIRNEYGEEIEAYERLLRKRENIADLLTFLLPFNTSYIFEKFITKIYVYEEVEELDEEVFCGRVIDIEESMNDEGYLSWKVTCESELNYLNDTIVGKWQIHPGNLPESSEESEEDNKDPFIKYDYMDVKKYLELILDNHNNKVTEDKKIYIGNVTSNEGVYLYTNREKSLSAIQEIVNKKEGYLKLRKENGKRYLDFLEEVDYEKNNIELGINQKSINRTSNLKNIVNRIIPIGANGLRIADINGGKDYVQDDDLVSKYGVMEDTIKWEDVTIAENLKKKALDKLKTINKENYSISVSVVDLRYIGIEKIKFYVSQVCQIKNSLLGVDDEFRIIGIEIPLDNPNQIKLEFSSDPPSGVTNSVSIKKEVNKTQLEMVVLEDSIISKVSKGELSTIVTQNAESWGLSINGKLKGTTYTFDGEGFHLGSSNTDSVVTHTNEYSEYRFNDGSICRIDKTGFYHKTGDSKNEYHNLNYTLEGSVTTQPNGVYQLVLQLPSEFKKKNLSVKPYITDEYIPPNKMGIITRMGIDVISIDKENAKITIGGQCAVVNLNVVKYEGDVGYYGFNGESYPSSGVYMKFKVNVTA